MNAWETCRELERVSRQHLRKYLFPALAFEGRYVHVDKGAMAQSFQATQGDYVVNSDDDSAWRIEHKCEYSNRHGNLFIETFSNLQRGNPGWFWKLEADFLLYHFVREGEVYVVRLPALRAWLFSCDPQGKPRAHKYRHKKQTRHDQRNDTWGYCVSIHDLMDGLRVDCKHVPPLVIESREPDEAA